MKSYPTEQIRNVALIGHSGAGKTILAEAMLFASGAIARMGKVEDGSTVCDHDPEETKKGVSVSMALAPIEWRGFKINIIDTPGAPDFEGDVAAALRVTDLAIFVVSGVDGPQVQTRQYWKIASRLGIPRAVFINKLDRERSSFRETVASLESALGRGFIPLQLPIGEEEAFEGLIDIAGGTGMVYSPGSIAGTVSTSPDLPADYVDLRTALIEGAAETDETLLDKYLEDGDLSTEEVTAALRSGVAQGATFPVLGGAGASAIGVDLLLDFVADTGPSPISRGAVTALASRGGDEIDVELKPDGKPLAQIFKTIADPFVGKLSLFRVWSGSIKPDSTLSNATQGHDERLHQIFAMRGKEHIEVDSVPTGDIAAVAKLGNTHTGDTFCEKGQTLLLEPIEVPTPVLAIAITPKTKGDEDKLGQALQRLAEEDQTIRVVRNAETHQTLLSGLGEAHLGIVIERLKRKFGVEVDTEQPKVGYRETIRKPAEAEGKHKKQSGGHGQFGVAHIKIEPLERDAGFEFVDAVVGGAIPRQFIPAVEKGVREALDRGGYAGFPIVDVRVTVDDGKAHSVDSNELSFKMAGSLAIQGALPNADVVLLEPIVDAEIVVPDDKVGDIQGDLNSKRGRIVGTDPLGDGETAIAARVPEAEMIRYAIDLRSITGGQGRFTTKFSHYEAVPAHMADKVKAAAGKDEG